MAGHPLRSATDRCLGRPLPCQQANQTRVHLTPPEFFTLYHAVLCAYAVLSVVSNCYPPVWGRLPTRYSPVRHSVTKTSFRRNRLKCFVRLACVKHAASVHPEPGSNSHKKCLSASFEQTSFNSLVSVKTYCFKGQHLIISYLMSVRKLKISKNFQGCFTVQLSMFIFVACVYSSAPTALIEYHVCHYLSTTFWYFLFFFTSLCLFSQKQESSMMWTEKEGFEPSRRY